MTFTAGVATASTTNAASYASGSFTPAANDLLFAWVTFSGNAPTAPYMQDSQALGWDLVQRNLYASSANKQFLFVAKKLAANSSMTVTAFTNNGNASGCVIQVGRISGSTLLGASAVKQTAVVANHAAGTPAPAFSSAALTGNLTTGLISNSTNPATMTPPTSWTEQSDTGYSTPTTGAEYVTRNSGFTGTTITWGNSSASAYGAIIAEFSANAGPSTPTLSSPSDTGTVSTTTPELDFSTTDPDSDTIRYEVQVDTNSSFNSASAVVGAIKFTASSGYLNDSTAISTALNTISFFTWLKLGSTGTDFMIWRNGIDTSFGQGYGFYISGADGSLNLDISFVANLQATNLKITDTNEHFVGFTCDAQDNWIIWLDGVPQAVGNAVPFSMDSNSVTALNAEYNGSGTYALNSVDATYEGTGFWERLVTTTEISNMYNRRIAPNKLANTSNLVGYFPFTNSGSWGANSGSGAALTSNGTITAATSGYPSPLLDKLSGTDTGFGDITNSGDSDPYPSGDSMKYTIQAGDALTNSTTYYWRVRAKDPTGSGLWSAWSTTRSFTVSTATSHSITKSLQYAVKTTPSAITKSLEYTIKRTPAAITKSLQYTIKKAISLTKSLQYTIKRTPSAITKSLKYTVKTTPSAITKSLEYTVKVAVSLTKSLKYTVKTTPSAITKALKYTIITTPSAITKSLEYDIASTVTTNSITKSLQYAIKTTPAALTKSLQYAVKVTPSAITKSLKYTLKTTPTALTKALEYTVLVTPSAITKSLQYAVLKTRSITKSLAYLIVAPTSLTKSLKYTVPSTKSITKSLKYTIVVTKTAITKSLEYAIKTTPALTKSLHYAVIVSNKITKNLEYTIKVSNALTKSLAYYIRTTPKLTKSLQYAIKAPTSLQKALQYSIIRTPSALSKGLQYSLIRQRSISLSLEYAIKKANSLTKTLQYEIKRSVSLTKSLQYTILKPNTITKSLQYAIRKNFALTKSLGYYVLEQKAITKSLQYMVKAKVVISLPLKYTLLEARSFTKSLIYHVRPRGVRLAIKSLQPIIGITKMVKGISITALPKSIGITKLQTQITATAKKVIVAITKI